VRGGAYLVDIHPPMHAHIRTCEARHAAYAAELARVEEE
jgi:hypothetical protein